LSGSVVNDTFAVAEKQGRKIPFLELFEVGGTGQARQERGEQLLQKMVSASVSKPAGIVELSVATPWPSVSRGIASSLLQGLLDFNRRTRQEEASSERKFIEERLGLTRAELRAAEDRMTHFLESNRQIAGSPELAFERDRLQREVSFQQAVLTSLAQSYEDARIRENRDTPTIVVIDPPSTASLPDSRGMVRLILIGILLGAFVGVLSAVFSDRISRSREMGDPEAAAFEGTLSDVKSGVVDSLKRVGARFRT